MPGIKTTLQTMTDDAKSYYDLWQLNRHGNVLPENESLVTSDYHDEPVDKVMVERLPVDNTGMSRVYHGESLSIFRNE